MNGYFFLIIPVVVGIVVGFALISYDSNTEKLSESSSPLTANNLIKNGSPILGEPNALITIIEWGDYQCTFCYRFHQSSLEVLKTDYIDTGKVKLVFKDFPLNGPDSILGAQASYCADDQGKYWDFHDELYQNWAGERTGWISRDALDKFAINVGLKLETFNACLDEKKYLQRVLDSYDFGQEIGIDATPSFLIFNDEKIIKIRGNQPLEVFERVIAGL